MYGTVSQTAVMVSRPENCAFYAYRETARPADGDAPADEDAPAAAAEEGPAGDAMRSCSQSFLLNAVC